MIIERCNYCMEDTETLEIPGGDCGICGFSKPTPNNLIIEHNEEWIKKLEETFKENDEREDIEGSDED